MDNREKMPFLDVSGICYEMLGLLIMFGMGLFVGGELERSRIVDFFIHGNDNDGDSLGAYGPFAIVMNLVQSK